MLHYSFKPFEQLEEIHQLPDPFLKPDGTRTSNADEWPQQRQYLKEMLAYYLYGEMPPSPGNVRGSVLESRAVDGQKAVEENIRITFGPENALSMDFQLLRPVTDKKCPVLIWNVFAQEECPVAGELLEHGIALIRFNKEQLGVDSHAFYHQSPCLKAYPTYSWRAIAVWAWGYSRIIDYLEQRDDIDTDKIAVTGYSRNGKVALCAAIYDERIAVAVPCGSGCGGSGNFRFLGGRLGKDTGMQETIGSMSQMFPFWWADGLREFGVGKELPPIDIDAVLQAENPFQELLSRIDFSINGKIGPEYRLPFDMHFARALVAPRPLLTTDSLDDEWANPYGIQISWRASAEVYKMLGVLDNDAMFFREGYHTFSLADWTAVADFLYLHLLPEQNIQPRSIFVTMKIPEDVEADRTNNMTSKWYCRYPHFDWRAPAAK